MKKQILLSVASVIALLSIFNSCSNEDDAATPINPTDDIVTPTSEEIVAIANRASGSVSYIDAETDQVIETMSIADSEPMYVVYVPAKDRLYVGDRANNAVYQIDPDTKEIEQTYPVGAGVFHMWADGMGNQLWVNNDIDNTISIIDLNEETVINTISLAVQPHDVFLTESGDRAYVSIFSNSKAPDSIYAYSTLSFAKIGARAVGRDPHLFHIPASNKLYVACLSDELYVLNGTDLNVLSITELENAHGLFPSPDRDALYLTNILGAQLFSVNTATDAIVFGPLDTTIEIPHNVVVNEAGTKLYVTHSGMTANTVTVYAIAPDESLSLLETVTVENNPFGLAYYSREITASE